MKTGYKALRTSWLLLIAMLTVLKICIVFNNWFLHLNGFLPLRLIHLIVVLAYLLSLIVVVY